MCSLASFIITVPFLALDIISLAHFGPEACHIWCRQACPPIPGLHPAGSVKSPHVVYSNPSIPIPIHHPSMNPSMHL